MKAKSCEIVDGSSTRNFARIFCHALKQSRISTKQSHSKLFKCQISRFVLSDANIVIHSKTNSTNLKSIQSCCNYCDDNSLFTLFHNSLYSFIQLNELGNVERTKLFSFGAKIFKQRFSISNTVQLRST